MSSGYVGHGTGGRIGKDGDSLPVKGGTIEGPVKNTSTDSFQVPQGTTSERDTPDQGKIRFNTETGEYEGGFGTEYKRVGGGLGASGNLFGFIHDNIVTQSYTIPASQNAISAGPLTINDDVTITIEDNATWVVV